MKASVTTLLVTLVFTFGELSAQVLTCPQGSSDECMAQHYHVQIWNPRTKNHTELYGINGFATLEACEAARAREEAAEGERIAYLRRAQPRNRMQPARFGPCHCDMTRVQSNPYFLDVERRHSQLRFSQDIRNDWKQELTESGATPDSTVVASLAWPLSTFEPGIWPRKLSARRGSSSMTLDPREARLKETTVTVNGGSAKPATSLDIVAVSFLEGGTATTETSPSTAAAPIVRTRDAFINPETGQIEDFLATAAAIEDGDVRDRVIEAAMQRVQLLSNLGKLIQTAGERSLLAETAGKAADEAGRDAMLRLIFGDTIVDGWRSDDPRDSIVSMPPAIETDPIAILRNPASDEASRAFALYRLLATNSSLTQAQELWLVELIEGRLRR